MKKSTLSILLVFAALSVLPITGCVPTTPATPVVVNQVGALSQVRMVMSADPKGAALRAYPAGTATVWCALEVYGSKLNGTDSYALRIMDTSGSSIAQVEIINNANLQLPKGTQIIMGGPVNPHKLAVPLASAAGAFPDGEYRLEIVLNGQVGASIPWTVGTVSR